MQYTPLLREIEKLLDRKLEEKLEEKLNKKFEEKMKFFVTRVEFDREISYIKTNMLTKKDFFDYMAMYEDQLQEMRDHRNARLLTEKQMADMDDSIADHEKRIRVLEKR